ncbi:hemerythrin family protein [candidate division KSB1 bacterium]|nr:hemerythrin family protein [candidate division KSB1 bacterium]
MAIQWVDSMATGLAWQDEQHQKLIHHVNVFLEAMGRREGQEEVGKLLTFLQEYAVEHFGHEETWMREHSDPELKHHHTEHERLLEELNKFVADFSSHGGSTMLVMHVQSWMRDWILHHVILEDRKMAGFARANGLS